MIFSVSVVLAVTVFRGPFWILELDKLSFRVLGKARRKSKADLTQSKQTKKDLNCSIMPPEILWQQKASDVPYRSVQSKCPDYVSPPCCRDQFQLNTSPGVKAEG